jgi:trafficking protein particle complex subunit 4
MAAVASPLAVTPSEGSGSGGRIVHALYVINRAGGLIYRYASAAGRSLVNDHLRLASTFHGLHAIARQLTPAPALSNNGAGKDGTNAGGEELSSDASGIVHMDAEHFQLECLQTITGLKFVVVAAPYYDAGELATLLARTYALYARFVLQNPFYELDMPIRVELFEQHFTRAVQSYQTGAHFVAP